MFGGDRARLTEVAEVGSAVGGEPRRTEVDQSLVLAVRQHEEPLVTSTGEELVVPVAGRPERAEGEDLQTAVAALAQLGKRRGVEVRGVGHDRVQHDIDERLAGHVGGNPVARVDQPLTRLRERHVRDRRDPAHGGRPRAGLEIVDPRLGEVHVRIDAARQHEAAGRVDDPVTRKRLGGHRDDPSAADRDVGAHGGAVDHHVATANHQLCSHVRPPLRICHTGSDSGRQTVPIRRTDTVDLVEPGTKHARMTRTSGDSGDLTSPTGSREEPEVENAFDRIVSEGEDRLQRPFLPLLSTGLLGGVDVGVGVLIYLVVEAKTDQPLLASLAFTVGFVALLMARSELFTENFLVPVTAVVAKVGSVLDLLRLWVVTLVANLAAGFVMALLTVTALPEVRETAVTIGSHYAHLGVDRRSFCLAVLAGAVITLLTRMQHATDQLGVKIVPAVLLSFVLVGAQLFHSVLDSILMFAGLLSGHAPYGYTDWLAALGWSALGNLVGGLGLVTSVRLLRVPHRVRESRQESGARQGGAGSSVRR